jgi:thiol-disulfide isomerase/thioredoxin
MFLKVIIANLIFITSLLADSSTRLVGEIAPSFGIKQWVQGNNKNLDMKDLKGKVIYISTFQDGCPYCHRYGLPALRDLHGVYKEDKDVQFLAIQTAFEADEEYDLQSIKDVITEYKLTMPVGNSERDEYGRPAFMDRYKTGGTPWVIIIDKSGIVRYSNFQLHEDLAMDMIDNLKREKIGD